MTSVADDLRARTLARVLGMTVRERIALALALGDDDAARLARSAGIDLDAARRQLAQTRRRGRTASRCAADPAS